ncbi:hypothetical protein G6O69_13535 [Pseudenhygromyxa sp. WMMC2535]|uniref:hypothetical protein n=1 Tax=Pseudenhygromyxa sp. WMMC2535 TaxID=2712867 RepID=UPI00155706C5|nr:hypothetical protein [Pseudenhygromyxa sp. WMMC2535]NVB38858.1 hypothetical protein [Pseudenhygromyxa sp. WMMC2535]
MRVAPHAWLILITVPLAACTIEGVALLPGSDEQGDSADEIGDDETGLEEEGDDPFPDLPPNEPLEPSEFCTLPSAALDGPLPCEMPELAESVAAEIRWEWVGPGTETSVLTTPLVANLDDDNGDGFIDVCDTPDVVAAVVDVPATKTAIWPDAHLYILSGDTGQLTRKIEYGIDGAVNPAIADLDGDGRPEIIALEAVLPNSPYTITERRLVAFDNQGELLWQGSHWQAARGGGALAIADLDGDGSPEIIAPEYVADADGELLWAVDDPAIAYAMPVAVDLDLDGDLEVVFGTSAYAHDGTHLFDAPLAPPNHGSVAIANFDSDPYPELYIQHEGAHGIIEHDGSLKAPCPTDGSVNGTGNNPAAIHDLDSDGNAELVFGYHSQLHVLSVADDTCTARWSRSVDANDIIASGTIFDLLDDGEAETIYADRSRVQIVSGDGQLLFQIPRVARESIANPVVADVDGDGAAEILVASSKPISYSGEPEIPPTTTLTLIDSQVGAFAPTRRVWNQHTYHYSNIREDARVPPHELPHWALENGFRINVGAGMVASDTCIPPWF